MNTKLCHGSATISCQSNCIEQCLPARIIALCVLLLLTFPAGVEAEDYSYTTNNGTITITGYSGPGGSVTIVDTINGLPVTGIGTNAFKLVTSMTSLTIPDSVTNIEDNAFQSCFNMTNVTFGKGVIKIGSFAFWFCTRIVSISLGTNVSSIGDYAFYQCTRLTNVTIPNSVINIADHAFDNCPNLSSVTIPNSVTNIGTGAFFYASSASHWVPTSPG
jgi:hypothetical protein